MSDEPNQVWAFLARLRDAFEALVELAEIVAESDEASDYLQACARAALQKARTDE